MKRTKKDWADKAVDKIILDLSDRRGLKGEWYAIDSDIQREIRQVWAAIIRGQAMEAEKL